MKQILKQCKKHIFDCKIFKNHDIIIKNIVETLNKDKIVILSGMKNVGKINITKELLSRTKLTEKVFYFNKKLDNQNLVNNSENLNNLLNVYIEIYNIPKIIILENISNIEGIKKFIPEIHKKNIKLIIIGNNLKISNINEIEILPESNSNKRKIERELIFGTLNDINYFNDINYLNNLKYKNTVYMQEKILTLLTNDIILNDIFTSFGIKNTDLYIYILSYIAELNNFTSLRELQKKLTTHQNISIKTTIDYIDYSLKSKIIKRIYNYDIKTKKIISSQSKYYFTDLGIRNSLTNFNLDKSILLENFIFNELQKKGYTVLSGKNGSFNFDFIAEKQTIIKTKTNNSLTSRLFNKNQLDETIIEVSKIYIHISKQSEKKEIKKEIKKLNKIKDDYKKFLIVENLESYNFKKFKYSNVKMIGVEGFLEN